MGNRLIVFYGTECVKCKQVDPLLEKLENEESVKVTRLEVWHDTKNADFLRKCGGASVPYLYNERTKESIFGVPTYDRLRAWALKK